MASADNSTTMLTLPCGPIIARLDNGLIHARGIKYAEAGRFEKPTPASAWTTPLDCTRPASICPQLFSRLSIVNGDIQQNRTQSEDCLHATVAAPSDAKGLPVMVFLHGGAYVSGGGDLDCYTPVHLARQGAVVVTVTYRLGIFGYLPIPGIAPPNLGLLDQIEALRWVKRNIAHFGGNPDQVTVFGQSAGGDAIACLLCLDEAQGLFHRAIVQSAPLGRFDDGSDRAKMAAAMAQRATELLGSTLSSATASAILEMQPELMKAATAVHPTLMAFAPILGEYPLPPPSELKHRLQAAAKRIPLFMGYTTGEGTAFAKMNPTHLAAFYQRIFEDATERFHKDVCDVVGESPIFTFTWHPEGSEFGAAHCSELPFLFGDEGWPDAPMLRGPDVKKDIETLGPQLRNLWVAFAGGNNLGGKRYVIDKDFTFSSTT